MKYIAVLYVTEGGLDPSAAIVQADSFHDALLELGRVIGHSIPAQDGQWSWASFIKESSLAEKAPGWCKVTGAVEAPVLKNNWDDHHFLYTATIPDTEGHLVIVSCAEKLAVFMSTELTKVPEEVYKFIETEWSEWHLGLIDFCVYDAEGKSYFSGTLDEFIQRSSVSETRRAIYLVDTTSEFRFGGIGFVEPGEEVSRAIERIVKERNAICREHYMCSTILQRIKGTRVRFIDPTVAERLLRVEWPLSPGDAANDCLGELMINVCKTFEVPE